ncbi:MAG: cobalamin-dependent protein [Candidatus Aminicenantes bacterium]|nr:cobalamin-dependent protein [Candidatus Aminicenantes bacterium]
MSKTNFPLFIVVGMPRSGTTFLYHNLNKHPDIFLPFRKEVNYFNVRHDLGVEWYNGLYKEREKNQVCGDISPPCFLDRESIARIKDYNPQAKIILSVRDPVEWALSFYSQFNSLGFNVPPFREFLEGYKYRLKEKFLWVRSKENYIIDTIELFMKEFGENILVYDFSYFRSNTLEVLKTIEKFIGVPSFFAKGNYDDVKINASGRKNIKFLSNITTQEWFASFLYKVFPRRVIQFFRSKFDKVSAEKKHDKPAKPLYADEDIKIAESALADQSVRVKKIFEKSPVILGNREPLNNQMNRKKLRVLLQEPFIPQDVSYGRYSFKSGNAAFPYGAASIARYIRDRGSEVEYLDPAMKRMERDDYIRFLRENRFDVIGISATTLQIDFALDTFRIIKENSSQTWTVLGGIHGTLLPAETMESCEALDFLVMQEGEKPFQRLLECRREKDYESAGKINGVCSRKGNRVSINPYDPGDRLLPGDIPTPLLDILPMGRYVAQITLSKAFPTYSVIASRGCAFQCTFCNANDVFGSKIRHKPIDTVLEEIRVLKENYGAKGIMFHDSTFTVNKKWVISFCRAFKDSGLKLPWSCNSRADTINEDLAAEMKAAGCWLVSFGLESANQKTLDLIKKGTTAAQNKRAVEICLKKSLCVNTNYILCLPKETKADVLNTITFAKALGNHAASFSLPIPFPVTGLRETCKRTGILRKDAKWSDYQGWDFNNPVYINPLIGKDNMKKLRNKAYLSFFLNPVVWYRNLKEIALFRQSPYKFWQGFKIFLSSLSK